MLELKALSYSNHGEEPDEINLEDSRDNLTNSIFNDFMRKVQKRWRGIWEYFIMWFLRKSKISGLVKSYQEAIKNSRAHFKIIF